MVAGCILGWSGAATAGDPALAEELFKQGKAAMAQKDYAAACPKLEASHDLDTTATGTLLNLAICHEALHANATAWAEFRQVAAESRDRREDRVKIATEGAERLFPMLDYLTVTLAPDANVPGFELSIDGKPMAAASLGVRLPVNPGHHVVEARAPGRLPARYDVELGAERDEKRVEIAPLAIEARRRPVVGFVIGGAGVAVLAGGVVTGVLALSARSDANAICGACVTGSPEAGRAHDRMQSARTLATVADVLVPVGAVATAVGAYLVLSPRSASSDRSARIAPALTGAAIEGTF